MSTPMMLHVLILGTSLLTAAQGVTGSSNEVDAEAALKQAYDRKLANPDYVKWKSLPGLPTGYQEFEEEKAIKALRASMARSVVPPPDVKPIRVPLVAVHRPMIDGFLSGLEWVAATEIPMDPPHERTRLFLQSDGKRLYLAADVPDERTGSGFDQFRFYYHVLGSSVIVNERIHVGTLRDDRLGGIRQTTVRWRGAPPANDDERWKKYPISDWRIYQHARGLSQLTEYRQYEAVLDLEEIGLHVGVPFPAFVEVETDPERRSDGKLDHRRHLGFLGSQGTPVWFVIDPELSVGEKRTARRGPPSKKPDLYKWTDEHGQIHFSNRPPNKQEAY